MSLCSHFGALPICGLFLTSVDVTTSSVEGELSPYSVSSSLSPCGEYVEELLTLGSEKQKPRACV